MSACDILADGQFICLQGVQQGLDLGHFDGLASEFLGEGFQRLFLASEQFLEHGILVRLQVPAGLRQFQSLEDVVTRVLAEIHGGKPPGPIVIFPLRTQSLGQGLAIFLSGSPIVMMMMIVGNCDWQIPAL